MSDFTIIHDISLELRHQIFAALASAAGLDLGLTDENTNVSLDPPSDEPATTDRASVYLYHVDINKNLRNQPMLVQPDQPDELRLPPMPLQLRYLLTPLSGDEDTNHLILGRLLQYFHDSPSFSTVGGEPIGDSFGGGSRLLRVRTEMLSVEQLSQIWNAFNQGYRLSVVLMVEVVAVDSGKAPVRVPRVADAFGVVGVDDR